MKSQATYDGRLRCCGETVARDAEAVQRVMTCHSLSAEAQGREWIRLSHELTDPEWGDECRRRARRMAEAVREEREILAMLGAAVGDVSADGTLPRPADGLAERHFEWIGGRKRVPVEVVRDGITALARGGFIGDDAEQQAALRRGLGIALNPAERTSRAPWVYWMGGAGGLHYLISSLWDMELIYCSGGVRDKWETLCGVFLLPDGSRFGRKIRGCCCRSERKRRAIDAAMLDGIRFLIKD